MAERIKLPMLTGFRLSGFAPIYSTQVSLKMGEGPYVVLGGNGLGKTTLMQAVVYGLAGGLDDKIEDTKWLRWSHSYFRGRLNSTQMSDANVEVDFSLGSHKVSVRRSFRGSSVVAVRENSGKWIENEADVAFARILNQYGGYLDPIDFSFVVHRLLYLPEDRRDIAWDTDAQIRLLMLLNQDVALESEFRTNRAMLKKLDSKKRHTHVAIGNAEKQLSSLMEYDPDPNDDGDQQTLPSEQELDDDDLKLPALVTKLSEVGRRRVEIERRGREASTDLSRVSAEIDKLRHEVELAEAGLIANFLTETEREHELALGKLITDMICPSCGQKHLDMAARARQFIREHRCALCGLEEPHDSNTSIDQQRQSLDDLLRQQLACEEVLRLNRAESDLLRSQELDVQAQVNEIRFSRPVVAMVERHLPEMTVESLKGLKERLINDEADLEAQIVSIRSKLEKDYQSFRARVDPRMDKLRSAYSEYATAFLGLSCELDEVEQTGLIDLKLYVPRFDESVRPEPESCSEAQRFFLDIAFRMALIDEACGTSGTGTFICETPETALDFSYVNNVVTMFTAFSKKRHNILLSANIQNQGIAEKILARVSPKNRSQHIVNLLELGRLSAVQEDARKDFKKIIARMLSNPQIKS